MSASATQGGHKQTLFWRSFQTSWLNLLQLICACKRFREEKHKNRRKTVKAEQGRAERGCRMEFAVTLNLAINEAKNGKIANLPLFPGSAPCRGPFPQIFLRCFIGPLEFYNVVNPPQVRNMTATATYRIRACWLG